MRPWASRFPPSQGWAVGLEAAGLGVARLLAVVDPLRFLPRISRLISMPFPKVGPEALPRFTRRLMGEGLLWSLAGWALMGLSLVAVVRTATSTAGVPVALAGVDRRRVAGDGGGVRGGGDAGGPRGARGGPHVGVDPLARDRHGGDRGARAEADLGARRGARRRGPVAGPPPLAEGTYPAGPSTTMTASMISIVIPVHNEAKSVPTLLDELDRVFAGNVLGEAEYVLVDDSSRDETWSIIEEGLAQDNPRVRAIRFRRNFGKAAALTAGFQAARGHHRLHARRGPPGTTLPPRSPGSWRSS